MLYKYTLFPDVGVEFDPTVYYVVEGEDSIVTLRVVKIGSADILVNVTVTTQQGSAAGMKDLVMLFIVIRDLLS